MLILAISRSMNGSLAGTALAKAGSAADTIATADAPFRRARRDRSVMAITPLVMPSRNRPGKSGPARFAAVDFFLANAHETGYGATVEPVTRPSESPPPTRQSLPAEERIRSRRWR